MALKDPFQFKALFFSLVGFFVIMTVLNFINQVPQEKGKKQNSQVQFDTKKIKKKKMQKVEKKKEKKKVSNQVKRLKPRMDLAFAGSGLNLGLDILGLSTQNSRLLSQSGDRVMTEDVVDRLPEVQYREAIPYPPQAKDQNINGHVTLNILINKEGSVEKVKLLESAPEGVFDHVAINAVKAWNFSPAEYKGEFVSVWVKQKLKFQVN